MTRVLIAHAEGEEDLAAKIAGPIAQAGYEVLHYGTILVGESLGEEASKAIAEGSPVVLCGTVAALGTGWAYRVVLAARGHSGARIFALQMEKNAYLDMLTLDHKVARYWEDPGRAVSELVAALSRYYPPGAPGDRQVLHDLDHRYREIALRTCDIVDLANLPIGDRDLVTKELLLRSLYVSLRVSVDIPPGVVEAEDLEHRLLEMESRRGTEGRPADSGTRHSVGERLQASKRLVVLGDPGSGKSTMLRWIATAYLLRLRSDPDWSQLPDVATLPDADLLPLLIRCRELDETRDLGSLERIIRQNLCTSGFSDEEAGKLTGSLLDGLRDGRVLLLIDGLDEISDPAARARFCRQIDKIHVAYPKSSIIVTSRIVGYKEMGLRITRGFEHVTVLDLTPEDKDDFARRWCVVAEPLPRQELATRQLISDIHSTDRIERLTGNPMLLTTMALVKKKVGKLPSRRADLYREAVDVLLNWRSDVDERIDRYEALPQLQYLAYAMCEAGVQRLREDEVVDAFERMRRDFPKVRDARRHSPMSFLRLLERRTGILAESGLVRHQGRLVPVYEFRHLTFQEYLAGLALVEGRYPGRDVERSLADQVARLAARTGSENPLGFVGDRAVSEAWREALRLCVMSCNDDDVDSVLRAIARPLQGEDAAVTARPRAVLACSCLSDEPNVSEEVAGEILDRFVAEVTEKDGLGSFITTADRAAGEVAGCLWGSQLSRRLVTAWLGDVEERMGMAGLAAMVLGSTVPDDEPGAKNWTENQVGLLREPQTEVAAEAALALMHVAFKQRAPLIPGLVPGLKALLRRGPGEAVAGAWALGWLTGNSPGRVRPGGPWTTTPEDRAELADVITTAGVPPQAVNFLLWHIDEPTAAACPDLAVAVMRGFAAADHKTRAALADHFVRVCPGMDDPVLPLTRHPKAAVRADAAFLLARLNSTAALDALLALLTDADDSRWMQAVEALGTLGDTRAAGPLLALLPDSAGRLRTLIAITLGRLREPRALEPLLELLSEFRGADLHGVPQALARLGDPRAVGPLLRVLGTDPPFDPTDALVAALAALGEPGAVAAFRGAMASKDAEERREALWSLARLEAEATDRTLLSADLDGESPAIDPRTVISTRAVSKAAAALALPEDEIRARYERLAQRYPLKLSWLRRRPKAKTP
ncbi:NACHT domain-containing NTPase [Streptomyces sp. Act143]|uniref:NACHT domain-containing protein n=1 Tax=Streptomyces sp. Act143 TaxID=2200760 RepID=UPI0015E81FFE|nr:HEAT repeat domain-containing protein [Streptomyces sp. Act143]